MGKDNQSNAGWIFGGLAVVGLTGVAITALIVTAPVTVTAGVTVAVGGASATAYISAEKKK